MKRHLSLLTLLLLLSGCAAATGPAPTIPVDGRDLAPGAAIALLDSNLQPRRLTDFRGEVLLVSIVPSLDTGVCERQTQWLAELLPQLPAGARAVTVSCDLPFAQARFAGTLEHSGILFLSDYAEGQFGRDSGLLVKEMMLLARGVLVVDRQGILRYRQLVPDIAHLPDLERALAEARKLAAK